MKAGILSLLVLCFLAPCVIALEKNYIYKGHLSSTDLVTGKTTALPVYAVFGDEELVISTNPNYSQVTVTLIVTGGPLGKKRYLIAPFGKFRSLEVKNMVKGKERVIEIFTRARSSNTEMGDGFNDTDANVLSGVHAGKFYETPSVLKGTGLSSFGTNSPDGIATGSASTTKFRLLLVRSLTDPIPTGESSADTVKRVEEHLKSRGFIQLSP